MFDNGLTRDSSGKRTDKTGERDLEFSQWHRKHLSNRCYATDIDFYEYRISSEGKYIPKAFLEVKKSHVRDEKYLTGANTKAIYRLSQEANVRFLIVLYQINNDNPNQNVFYVWEVTSEEQLSEYTSTRFEQFFRRFSNREFIEFMENL